MSAIGPDDKDALQSLLTDPDTATDDTYLPIEHKIHMMLGIPLEMVHEMMTKDRLLDGAVILADVRKLSQDGGITEYLKETYAINERELFSLQKLAGMAIQLGEMGNGMMALISMFVIGAEFAGKETPDYSSEDHEWWLDKHPLPKNYMGEDEEEVVDSDEVVRLEDDLSAIADGEFEV